MTRLAHDVRGNTLAMMAIALIPIAALVGSGVDTARMYVVKVRLQQACDAGVLAGRKAMMSASSDTFDANARSQASTFFKNNFRSGWLGTNTVNFAPAATQDNQVMGTASVVVPMTVMRMFGMGDTTLRASCQARYDVADSDVMFVLDTTGSMACVSPASSCGQTTVSYTRPDGTTGYKLTEANGAKIQGLRSAVVNFYNTVDETASASKAVIRYGFVTYSSAVNTGYAITSVSPDFMVKNWKYQSRRITGETQISSTTQVDSSVSSSSDCSTKAGRFPGATYTATDPYFGDSYTAYPFNANGTATKVTTSWSSNRCNVTTQTVRPLWTYKQVGYDVSNFVKGTPTVLPSKVTGESATWQGCIEERDTKAQSSFDINNLPGDLDPNLIPSNDATRWRPMWPDVEYYRNGNSTDTNYGGNGRNINPYSDYAPTSNNGATTAYTPTAPYYNPSDGTTWAANNTSGYVVCGKPAQLLQKMTLSDISNYVNATDFGAIGGTYHDTGMIWGTRMISPKGIFADHNKGRDGYPAPNRYIVFMTDGEMAPNASIYGMYGMEKFDTRITGSSGTGNLLNYHNARFVAECSAAKAMNIKVFVVGFGQSLNSQLTDCASPGQAYYASDNASLNAAFQQIAKQVALLRISQ